MISDDRLAVLIADCRVLVKLHPDSTAGPGPNGWRDIREALEELQDLRREVARLRRIEAEVYETEALLIRMREAIEERGAEGLAAVVHEAEGIARR